MLNLLYRFSIYKINGGKTRREKIRRVGIAGIIKRIIRKDCAILTDWIMAYVASIVKRWISIVNASFGGRIIL